MRLKMIAGNLIVVLLVGATAYFVVKQQVTARLADRIDSRIGNDAELLSRSWRLAGTEFAAQVHDRAAQARVTYAFLGAVGEKQRRSNAFDAAQAVSAWFQDPARGRTDRPDIVALIDETGTVIARDTDPNRLFGKALINEVPAIREVLDKGVPTYDVWNQDTKLLQIAIASVRNVDGGIVGALLVGYDLSNGLAKREASVLGRDVVFLTDKRIYSSSTTASVRDSLQQSLYTEPLKAGTQAALSGRRSSPWAASIDGRDYVGVTARLPNVTSLEAGFVVLADKTEGTAPASAANVILMLTLLGLIGIGVYGSIVSNNMIAPLEQIEDGLLAIINGRTDVRLEVESREFGGLAYRINQLLNMFMGVAEEDEQGRTITSTGAWSPVSSGVSAPPVGAAADDASLAAEPAAQYYARLYQEYVSAKRAVGEDVSNIAEDRFIERIKGNEAHLMSKHDASMVRFRVERDGKQVNLTPVIIK